MKPRKPLKKPSFKNPKKSPVVSFTVERKDPTPPPVPIVETPPALSKEEKDLCFRTAKDIADWLQEKEPLARKHILVLVFKVGPVEANALYEQALFIEATGGLMLPDGSRRRTLGGVFFFLARVKYPELFIRDWKAIRARKKAKKQLQKQCENAVKVA